MPTARKTKSGTWRCQAFDHVEITPEGKKKYFHKSFTARTKYEAERLARELFSLREGPEVNQEKNQRPMTLAEAAREAEIIQRDFERALAEWYLFAPDGPALDFGGSKKLHD